MYTHNSWIRPFRIIMIQTNLSLSSTDDNESCITNRSLLTDEEKWTILLYRGCSYQISLGGHSYGGSTFPLSLVCLIALTIYGLDIQVVQVFVSSTSNVSGLGCLVLWMRVFTWDDLINYSKNPSLYQSLWCAGAGFLLEYAVWVKLMFMFCLTFHLFSIAVFHADQIRF